MSPSEEKALKEGVFLKRMERISNLDERGRRLRFYDFRLSFNNRRHALNVYWHTKAGAWQAALRWAKRLKSGGLK